MAKSKYTYQEMEKQICFCGKSLHYSDLGNYEQVQRLVEEFGEFIKVVSIPTNKTYAIPRHYIALHGLKQEELPELGFKEVQKDG